MRWGGWLLSFTVLWAQDTVYITIAQAEKQFLERNLYLIAQKLRIEAEKALVWQARLWPNPQLTIDQVDLFTRAEAGFDAGPWLSTPRANQIAATLSQTLLTAGKRLKGVALAEASVRIQEAALAELLRTLRYQLLSTLYAVQRDQILLGLLQEQLSLLDLLRRRYRQLSEQALVPLPEYLRIENLYLQVQADLRVRRQSWEEAQHTLRVALRIDSLPIVLWIDTTGFFQSKLPQAPPLDSLLLQVYKRGDVRIAQETSRYQKASWAFEKALAYPDVDVLVSYDRLGGYRLNQLGVGFALPLPLFARNQGRIKAAQLSAYAADTAYQQTILTAQSEILRAWRNFLLLQKQWENTDPTLLERYRRAETAYRENLLAGRIGFLTYVDFFQSYRDLTEMLMELFYLSHQTLNELSYAVGTTE
ncbi:MAG: TolC family protein [Bacteroidia bacterium]|nr:TolC family protein [Bacteroidia bacterium]